MADVTAKLAEALRLAYEALSGSTDKTLLPRAHRAVEQALAAHEQAQAEPVAWMIRSRTGLIRCCLTEEPDAEHRALAEIEGDTITPLFAAPVAQAEPRPCTCHPSDNPPTPCVQQYALKLCRAAAPVAQAEQWQPIETAPKDGRKLLLFYTNSHGKHRTVFGSWVTDEEAAETDADGVGLEAGWYERIDNWPDYTQVAIHEGEPSHWMPLPQPPKENQP